MNKKNVHDKSIKFNSGEHSFKRIDEKTWVGGISGILFFNKMKINKWGQWQIYRLCVKVRGFFFVCFFEFSREILC